MHYTKMFFILSLLTGSCTHLNASYHSAVRASAATESASHEMPSAMPATRPTYYDARMDNHTGLMMSYFDEETCDARARDILENIDYISNKRTKGMQKPKEDRIQQLLATMKGAITEIQAKKISSSTPPLLPELITQDERKRALDNAEQLEALKAQPKKLTPIKPSFNVSNYIGVSLASATAATIITYLLMRK